MIDHCINLSNFTRFERNYVLDYLRDMEIENHTREQYLDAFEELAQEMRETYCGGICPYTIDCLIGKSYLKKDERV